MALVELSRSTGVGLPEIAATLKLTRAQIRSLAPPRCREELDFCRRVFDARRAQLLAAAIATVLCSEFESKNILPIVARILNGEQGEWVESRTYATFHLAVMELPQENRGSYTAVRAILLMLEPVDKWQRRKRRKIRALDAALEERDSENDVILAILTALREPTVAKDDMLRALEVKGKWHKRAVTKGGLPRRVDHVTPGQGVLEEDESLTARAVDGYVLGSKFPAPDDLSLDLAQLIEAAVPERCAKARAAARKKLVLQESLTIAQKGNWEMTAKPRLRAYCQKHGILTDPCVSD